MTGAPMLADLPYVYRIPDRHGNDRVYYWRGKGHRRIRLRAEIGTEAFAAEYAAAAAGTPAPTPENAAGKGMPAPRTLRWLCVEYMKSAAWKQLGARTRYVRKGILERIFLEPIKPGSERLFADFPLEKLQPKSIRVIRDRRVDVPESANSAIKALRQVFAWAMESETAGVTANPARDVAYLKGKPGGFKPWGLEQVEQFVKRHPPGSKAFLALSLLMFTGVRRSDVVQLGRQMVRGEWLTFTEFKGRDRNPKRREIPVLPILRRALDMSPTGDLTFLVTEFGKPFSRNGFGNWFHDRCVEAGLVGFAAHGVRKAAATIAAENGATAHELMAIFGWEKLAQAEVYTRQASRKRLAGSAMHKLLPAPEEMDREQNSLPPARGGFTT